MGAAGDSDEGGTAVGTVYVAWGVSAAVLLLAAVVIGASAGRSSVTAVLIDRRGRYSLSRLQLVIWTFVVISLLSGVFWGRLLSGSPDPLGVRIPDELLALLGVNVLSTVGAAAVKAHKDNANPENVSASDGLGPAPDGRQASPARFVQVFLQEEGSMADRAIDVTKFQSFWFTILVVVGYLALAISTIGAAASPDQLTSLPAFSGTLVTLLGLSHAGYLAGKLPSPGDKAAGLTVADKRAEVAAEAGRARPDAGMATPEAQPAG
jgi:hypothetical protein